MIGMLSVQAPMFAAFRVFGFMALDLSDEGDGRDRSECLDILPVHAHLLTHLTSRSTSLIRNSAPLGHYCRKTPRALWRP